LAQLALAIDVPLEAGAKLYRLVAPHVPVAKVGLSLFVEHGPRAVEVFREAGAQVFLDLKLHDIPNTVELAAARAAALGVKYLTVHAGGGRKMVEAAVKGARTVASPPTVLAVTVLTSLDAADLISVGVVDSPGVQVERLARVAIEAGAGGLVCSVREAASLRAALGPSVVLCTPGIRPVGAAKGDQARVDTPDVAVKAGADLLVVGRPIYEAGDPLGAARDIAQAISRAA
jgi:orotidine-5'-phosphate decarboxylase